MFVFSSRRRHTSWPRDWSSDVCSSDLEAFAPARTLEKEDGSRVKKGEELEFVVIEFNKEFRRVVVSHSATYREEEERQAKKAIENQSTETATLGDLDELAELKKKMEGK